MKDIAEPTAPILFPFYCEDGLLGYICRCPGCRAELSRGDTAEEALALAPGRCPACLREIGK